MDITDARTAAHGLLHLESDLSGEHDEAFTRWCDEVHHPELLRVGGFLGVRRFAWVGGDPGARFLTVYELADPAAASSEEYQRHSRTSTPMPPDVAAGLSFARTVYALDATDQDDATDPGRMGEAGVLQVLGESAPAVGRADSAAPGVVGVRSFFDVAGQAPPLELLELDDLDAEVPLPPDATARRYRPVFAARRPSPL